jgi:hypothetical protein
MKQIFILNPSRFDLIKVLLFKKVLHSYLNQVSHYIFLSFSNSGLSFSYHNIFVLNYRETCERYLENIKELNITINYN